MSRWACRATPSPSASAGSRPWDHQARLRYNAQRELYDVVNALRAVAGVTAIETRMVLREVLDR